MSTSVFKPKLTQQPSACSRALARVGKMASYEIHGILDEISITQKGVATTALDALVGSVVTQSDLNWVIAYRTLARRKQKGERLSPVESGRWLRAAKIVALAEEVFGDQEKASHWLHKPRKTFNNQSALEIMQTESGAILVEEKLNQIDIGYFA